MVQLGVKSQDFAPLKQEVMNKRPIDGVDHLEGRNLPRIPGQRVAAIHAGMGAQRPDLGQPLQNLGQKLGGDAVGVSDVFGAQGRGLRVLGQVLERHEPVIRFFGEL